MQFVVGVTTLYQTRQMSIIRNIRQVIKLRIRILNYQKYPLFAWFLNLLYW
jgi:hypothetical protein